jgi:hypothetical protein
MTHQMAGWKREVSVTADTSHSLSIIGYLLKRLLTNQLNDTESSFASARQVIGE